ncbi:MAG: hypothetical protein FWD69_04840 [Polyangiaceae bacterium]|nr:hypothetical protein [Polyangiaceae bacterium]
MKSPSLVAMAFLVAASGCTKPSAEKKEQLDANVAPASDAGVTSPAPAAKAATDAGVINATALPAASIAAMVNPSNLPAYAGATGSIEGTIWVTGDAAPTTPADFAKCPEAASIWGHAFREGAPPAAGAPAPGARPLADAIVVVTGYQGFYVPEKNEAKEVVIDHCGYRQRTVTLTFGQRLEVRNLSREFWTPKLEPGANQVMMMAAPKGDPVRIYPTKPGHWLLTDAGRGYAVVDVYAFLHPLHTSTDAAGHYRIEGVPLGKVTVNTTHPHIPNSAGVDIDIQANVVHKVDLVLHNEIKKDAAAPHPDATAPTKPR